MDAGEYSAIERGPKWSHHQDGEYDEDKSRQQADRQRGSRVGLRSHQATDFWPQTCYTATSDINGTRNLSNPLRIRVLVVPSGACKVAATS